MKFFNREAKGTPSGGRFKQALRGEARAGLLDSPAPTDPPRRLPGTGAPAQAASLFDGGVDLAEPYRDPFPSTPGRRRTDYPHT